MSTYDPTKYTDVMVDLETLGTAPGSAVISIGAVMFTWKMPREEWVTYEAAVINRSSCLAVGLTEDKDTMDWWRRQDGAARLVWNLACQDKGGDLVPVLREFASFFPKGARLWGNGANFDNVLLREAYRHARVEAPWNYWDDSCYRTLKNRFTTVPKPAFQGTQHKALDDALHQTEHLQAIMAYIETVEQNATAYAMRSAGARPDLGVISRVKDDAAPGGWRYEDTQPVQSGSLGEETK